MGWITKIETLVFELKNAVNFGEVNCNFPIKRTISKQYQDPKPNTKKLCLNNFNIYIYIRHETALALGELEMVEVDICNNLYTY